MPLYDYQCSKCGYVQKDVVAKIDDRDSRHQCPDCGSDRVERLVSTVRRGGAHMFKAGYYEHIAEQPIYCGTKADLRAACRNNNSGSDYAW